MSTLDCLIPSSVNEFQSRQEDATQWRYAPIIWIWMPSSSNLFMARTCTDPLQSCFEIGWNMVVFSKPNLQPPKFIPILLACTVDSYGNTFASLTHPSTILYNNGTRRQSPGGMFIERMTSYFIDLLSKNLLATLSEPPQISTHW